jgi:hypothetical protein
MESETNLASVTSYLNGSLICPSLVNPWVNHRLFPKVLTSVLSHATDKASPIKVHPHVLVSPSLWYVTFHCILYSFRVATVACCAHCQCNNENRKFGVYALPNCMPHRMVRNQKNLLNLARYSRDCLDDIKTIVG